MIDTLLDACQYVLEVQGEAQSSYWLSSIMLEMKLWRASEVQVRRALDRDIKKFGDSSPFVKVDSRGHDRVVPARTDGPRIGLNHRSGLWVRAGLHP